MYEIHGELLSKNDSIMEKRREKAEIAQRDGENGQCLLEMHGIAAWSVGIGLKPKKDWDLRIPKVRCKHCGRKIKDYETCWYDGKTWGVYCNDCVDNYYYMDEFGKERLKPLTKEELASILEKQDGKVNWYETEVLPLLKRQQECKSPYEKLLIGLKQK